MKTLIIVDVQKDFVSGGNLEVPNGDEVIEVANELIPEYELVVATQDWHPANHQSFASWHDKEPGTEIETEDGYYQTLWPDHCISGTEGAKFCDGLMTRGIHHIIKKGTDPKVDSYSAFYDNHRKKKTDLSDFLKDKGVKHVDIIGLALDYCVSYTAIDAVGEGFSAKVLLRGCRGVELTDGDCQAAIQNMRLNGVEVES